jgi:hypothetical protein
MASEAALRWPARHEALQALSLGVGEIAGVGRIHAEQCSLPSYQTRSSTTATVAIAQPMKSGSAASEVCVASNPSTPRRSWAHNYRPAIKCR